MGRNYITFDRKEAEGYARALRKQREREAKEAEERRIWSELADEELRKNRSNSSPVQPKRRIKPARDDYAEAIKILKEVIKAIHAHVESEIAFLKRGGVYKDLLSGGSRDAETAYPCTLAVARMKGGRKFPRAIIVMYDRVEKLLKGSPLTTEELELLETIKRETISGRIRTRMCAREIIKTRTATEKQIILDYYKINRAMLFMDFSDMSKDERNAAIHALLRGPNKHMIRIVDLKSPNPLKPMRVENV